MTNVSAWNVSAGANTDAPPDGAPEGIAPSTVNDIMREMMAALARWYSDSDGTLVTVGTGNAYVLTTNSAHTVFADQPIMVFRLDRTNTGPATLNVDTLGAKPLRINGQPLVSGELVADKVTIVAYNATDDAYDLIGPSVLDGFSKALGTIIVGDGANFVAESGTTARASLGLDIGIDVQAWDQALQDILGLAVTDGNFIVGDGANFVAESGATARTSLGLGTSAVIDEDTLAINTDQLITDYAQDGSGTFTVGDGDAESIRRFTVATTVTLPNSIPTNWAVGDSMGFIRGSGLVTFTSPGTIRSPGSSTIIVQHGKAVVTLAASGVWELSGNV